MFYMFKVGPGAIETISEKKKLELEKLGYTDLLAKEVSKDPRFDELDERNKKELLAYALDELGVDIPDRTNKPDIIAKIIELESQNESES